MMKKSAKASKMKRLKHALQMCMSFDMRRYFAGEAQDVYAEITATLNYWTSDGAGPNGVRKTASGISTGSQQCLRPAS